MVRAGHVPLLCVAARERALKNHLGSLPSRQFFNCQLVFDNGVLAGGLALQHLLAPLLHLASPASASCPAPNKSPLARKGNPPLVLSDLRPETTRPHHQGQPNYPPDQNSGH